DPCMNVYIGAKILANYIQKYGYTWEAIGCYNASSKSKRNKYISKISRALPFNNTTTIRRKKHQKNLEN
ncbi:MAG: lytic transglycosylase domain-containing protein, partial [Caldisericum exile]|uniref:lytic transglycosylase domain-containing protein n=1 Tax=Caldisericum exile TaxID=693075 RepID=UPI003C71412D